jgi:hypothetical protein
MDLAVGEDLD